MFLHIEFTVKFYCKKLKTKMSGLINWFSLVCRALYILGGGGKGKDQRFLTNAKSEPYYTRNWTQNQVEQIGATMIKEAHAIFCYGRYTPTFDNELFSGRSNVGAREENSETVETNTTNE